MDAQPRGLFATRAAQHPNAIGLSVVRLLSVQGWAVQIENVDILDGTPLLDIKPYVPDFDGNIKGLRLGWLEKKATSAKSLKSDDAFDN